MNQRLRAYLETIGLKKGASDAVAAKFWSDLKGDQRAKADALATGADAGGGAPTPDAPEANQTGNPKASSQPAGGETISVTPQAPPTPGAEQTTATLEAAAPSRSEIQGIATEVARFNPDMNVDAFTVMHSLLGSSLADVQKAAAVYMESVMQPLPQTAVTVGDDGRESMAAGISDVIAERMDVPVEAGQRHARAGEFEHLSTIEIGRRWLGTLGVVGAESMPAEQVAVMMLDRHELQGHLGGVAAGHTTSDFTGILSTSATKSLIAGFTQETVTYQQWTASEQLKDLNEWEEYAGGGVPLPQRVAERGEYEMETFAFKAEKKRVHKYGLKVGLTLEMMINDRLNAFSEQLFDFGGASAALRNLLCYEALAGNPTMNEDGLALFSAGHNNLNQGGATALSIATEAASRAAIQAIGEARTAMRQQKAIPPKEGTEGRNIRIPPKYLLVPEEAEIAATTLLGSVALPGQTNSGVKNPAAGFGLTIISDPELSDASASAWYLVGDKRKSPVKALTLRGYATPTVTTKSVMENDTKVYQLRDFAGAAVTEWRSAQRNDGE